MSKILIVDDNEEKLSRISHILTDAGVTPENINIAKTGVEARKCLSGIQFDLLILDIALPMREGDEPDRRGGIKLLEEIVERGNFRLPDSVLGLTGFSDLHEEFGEQFHSMLWTLDYYDTSDSGWLERLRAKVSYVLARTNQGPDRIYQSDLCVVTALHSLELEALRSLPWGWRGPQSLDEVGFYFEGGIECGENSTSVVAAAAPRMGMVASALLTQKMIAKFRPKYLCMVGICAGVRGRCDIGDIIVADPAWDWQMGKHGYDGFSFAPDQIALPIHVTEKFVQMSDLDEFWFGVHKKFSGSKPANLPTIKVGPVASGSSILADGKKVKDIQQQHRQLLGVEMELYGVYSAARDATSPQPTAFGIKAVSDFADDHKSDEYQRYAAFVSVQTLAKFCSLYLLSQ